MSALRLLMAMLILAGLTAACAGTEESESQAGVRIISAESGGELLSNPPEGLVVLDVRTPAEFAEGHIPGAIMIDYNAADFADKVAELDPNVPYLLYCRSGNRSSGARALMENLGFTDVSDIDGGFIAWADAGLPSTS